MGAKKKKEKKSEGEKVEEQPKKNIPIIKENWVNIDFKLLNWKYMNFSMKFREDTHIFTLKKILQERHGRIDDLKLCFHSFTEMNEIHDEMLTLKMCGLKGAPADPDEIRAPTGVPGAPSSERLPGSASPMASSPTPEGTRPSSPMMMGEGSSRGDPTGIPTYQLFYDFKPTNYSDPVVLYFH